MKNAWVDTILQIRPDYPEIVKQWENILTNGPKILTKIEFKDSEWQLEVCQKEEFEQFDPLWFSEEMYDRLAWCEKQLANWDGATRKNYSTWIFHTQENAEKFQTLYNLKWTQ